MENSNRKGKAISVYLRAEDLVILDFLSDYYKKNRSETIQLILEQFKYWFDLMIPIMIKSILMLETLEIFKKD